jgi:hypothetical protein
MRNISTILISMQRDLHFSSDTAWPAKSAVFVIFAAAMEPVMMRDQRIASRNWSHA